ncbi:hypothetical protein [Desulfolutivibrio sulfoxidireducens]|uniref:hypothetical protein n=1 Tax=Desulfolutivibrio sulfoxidireducens TaxID=2773299 RepID=UPI00159DF6D2|nr:hypothetical protein [Desulfolutivibrio sulfoxidireducens]QLA15760.1 hypothetical protein GD605_06170 [Desulfolutivibrio sulfoxidireducens]
MTKRETMLLWLMGAAVLAGAGLYGLTGKGKSVGLSAPGKAVEATLAAGQALVKAVKDAGVSDIQAHVATMALRPWEPGLFYDKALEFQTEGPKSESLPAYTGFVEVGSLRLAIIDGYEYREGDELETGGYLVEEIRPDQVTLKGLDKDNKAVRLPYQDPSFFTQ